MAKPVTVLCVGDVFGEPGRRAIQLLLPKIRKQHDVDLAVVNVENAASGAGVTPPIAKAFLDQGVDVMTSGNHIWDKREIIEYIVKENLLLRPANYPPGTPGAGSIVVKAGPHKVAVLNLMGRVFLPQLDCPFRKADEEIARLRAETALIVVDAHCEATSESQALGWYLDGRVSAVVGTHRHVQTADERLLPKGTAYITDLGMTGPTDSVIGVDPEIALSRFLTQMPNRFEPAKGPVALHGALIRIDPDTGRGLSIERLRVPLPA
jgi:metallophosphoesterase (TIGR00282 family)